MPEQVRTHPNQSPALHRVSVWSDWRTWVVLAAASVCVLASGVVSPPMALGAGLLLALLNMAPKSWSMQRAARMCIQVSVVLMGFGMDLREVLKAGAAGMLFAAATIVATLALGVVFGRLFRTERTVTTLVSSGTAICGGSAIAAVGSVIGAAAAPMGVAMGTVFILNAIGVFALPRIGVALHMTPEQFGVWSAIAVHDIAGVTGAADGFDRLAGTSPEAVTIATAIKLARTLWIIPLALVIGWWFRRASGAGAGAPRARTPVPWFIALFVVAAGARTLWPVLSERVFLPKIGALGLVDLGKRGMLVALLLIGCGLSIHAMRQVGWRAMALGAVLWVCVCAGSFAAVRVIVTH